MVTKYKCLDCDLYYMFVFDHRYHEGCMISEQVLKTECPHYRYGETFVFKWETGDENKDKEETYQFITNHYEKK